MSYSRWGSDSDLLKDKGLCPICGRMELSQQGICEACDADLGAVNTLLIEAARNRLDRRKYETPGEFLIESTHDKCWIHHSNGLCIARLCKDSGELINMKGQPISKTAPKWDEWRRCVSKVFGINVPNNMKPGAIS